MHITRKSINFYYGRPPGMLVEGLLFGLALTAPSLITSSLCHCHELIVHVLVFPVVTEL